VDEIKQDEKEGPYNIAYIYAFCGDADKAFEWLDKAIAYQDPGLGNIVVENLFDKIHSDPRWVPFLRKIGKAPRPARQDRVQSAAAAAMNTPTFFARSLP
jgi:hypothetical protein